MEPKYSNLANFMQGEATYTIFFENKSEWPTPRDAIATTVSGSQLIKKFKTEVTTKVTRHMTMILVK